MPTKASDRQYEDAISAYIQGTGIEQCGADFHIGTKTLRDVLEARQLLRDSSTRYAVAAAKMSVTRRASSPVPEHEIIKRYIAGESEKAIADSLNVSRSCIVARLHANGVPRRSLAEANRLMMAALPREEQLRRIRIAQEANRGRKAPLSELINRARARQTTLGNQSHAERLLNEWLRHRGLNAIPQQAIGKYNVDIGTHPVAVEVMGGGWHAYGKHLATLAERTRYILDQGWNLVFIWNIREFPLRDGAADYIVTFAEESRRDPSVRGQYRVIGGDGKPVPEGRHHLHNIAFVPPLSPSNSPRS